MAAFQPPTRASDWLGGGSTGAGAGQGAATPLGGTEAAPPNQRAAAMRGAADRARLRVATPVRGGEGEEAAQAPGRCPCRMRRRVPSGLCARARRTATDGTRLAGGCGRPTYHSACCAVLVVVAVACRPPPPTFPLSPSSPSYLGLLVRFSSSSSSLAIAVFSFSSWRPSRVLFSSTLILARSSIAPPFACGAKTRHAAFPVHLRSLALARARIFRRSPLTTPCDHFRPALPLVPSLGATSRAPSTAHPPTATR